MFERNVFVEIKIYFIVNGFVFLSKVVIHVLYELCHEKCAFYTPGIQSI